MFANKNPKNLNRASLQIGCPYPIQSFGKLPFKNYLAVWQNAVPPTIANNCMNTENANANTNGIASGEVIHVTDLQQQQHIQPNQNITDIFFESDITKNKSKPINRTRSQRTKDCNNYSDSDDSSERPIQQLKQKLVKRNPHRNIKGMLKQ